MANEQESYVEDEDFVQYTEEVIFVINGIRLFWDPEAGDVGWLYGARGVADDTAENIKNFIWSSGPDGEIAATPEGPFLPATPEDLYTVVWALNTIYPNKQIKVIGKAPTMEDMGLDDASNFDENGNEIIR